MNSPLQPHKYLSYIAELRQLFIRILSVVAVTFMFFVPFSRKIYELFSAPLLLKLPTNSHMIATDITSTFIAPFKLTFWITILVLMPFIFYQIWRFVRTALYERERKIFALLLPCSIALFYAGIAVAYFIALPVVLGFFMNITPDSVTPMTDIYAYLTFCLQIFFVFGLTFQIPVFTLILILLGIVSIESLAAKRKFIIVGCFFIAIFITPPDVLSMALVGTAMWLLFELGLFCAKLLNK